MPPPDDTLPAVPTPGTPPVKTPDIMPQAPAFAETAPLITPQDAAEIDRLYGRKVPADIYQRDYSMFKEIRDKQEHAAYYNMLMDSPESAEWLQNGVNRSLVQDDIRRLVAFNNSIKSRLPEPAGITDVAWAGFAYSVKKAAQGVAGVATLPIGVAQGLLGTNANITTALSEAADDTDRAFAAESADINQRMMDTGGSRWQSMVGQILGQTPEMLASGFGAVTAAKLAAGGKAALTTLTRSSIPITTENMTRALTASSMIQAGQESGQNLVDRMRDNMDAGKELISAADVAATAAIAATIFFTERLAGFTGEARLLGGKAPGTWRAVGSDIAIQSGIEGFQELSQSIINDLADRKHIDWTEAKWAAFAGMIGGGLFSTPAVLAKFTEGAKPGDAARIVQTAQVASSVASISASSVSAQGILERQQLLRQTGVVKHATADTVREMLAATSGADKRIHHFDKADFAEIAAKVGTTLETLAVEWGGVVEGGTVSIPEDGMQVGLLTVDDATLELVLDNHRIRAHAQSLREGREKIKELMKMSQEKEPDAVLPDGTKDDSAEVAKVVEEQIKTAGTKISKKKAADTGLLHSRIARTRAIRLNDAYARAGMPRRVTPMEVWNADEVSIEGGEAALALQQPSRGGYDPVKRIVHLGKKADVTTINHELMHHHIATTQRLAQSEGSPPEFREELAALGAWATKNVKSVVKHARKSNIDTTEDAVKAAAADMLTMDFNTAEGKAIHEAITGAFEEYLASGKAPTNALRAVFARMAAAFARIYKALLAANTTGTPLLNDDVAGVFDRMIRARDEAEATRLVFTTPESLGISSEQFALVQDVRLDAIAKAQAQNLKALEARAANLEKQDLAKIAAGVRERLLAEPKWRAKDALPPITLNRAAVEAIAPSKVPALKDRLVEAGADPAEVAVGYDYPQGNAAEVMLNDLADPTTLDQAVEAEVAAIVRRDPLMTQEERIEELMEQAHVRAGLAARELRAIQIVLNVADRATRETRQKAATEKAAALEELETEFAGKLADAKEKARYDKKKAEIQARWDIAGERQKAATEKAETIAAVEAKANADIAFLSERAAILVSKTPVLELKAGVWEDRADAARRRRERAIAEQKPMSILQASQEEVWCEIMEAETLRTLETKADISSALDKRMNAVTRVDYQYAGRPTIRYQDGSFRTFSTMEEAMRTYEVDRLVKEGAQLRKGNDVVNIRDALKLVFSRKERDRGIAALRNMLTGQVEGAENLLAPFRATIQASASGVTYAKGNKRLDPLDPDTWTMDQWLAVMQQTEYLDNLTELRPKQEQDLAAAQRTMIAAIPTDRTAPPPIDALFLPGVVRGAIAVGHNLPTLGQYLGDAHMRLVQDPLRKLEGDIAEVRATTGKPIEAALSKFTKQDRKLLDTEVQVAGITTNGWERLTRLLLMGTASGKQRVVEDLKLRGVKEADIAPFLVSLGTNLTEKEANLLDAWWKSNEHIWQYLQASATRAGIPIPPPLKATPFKVMVDGKAATLTGGYAAIPYDTTPQNIPIFDENMVPQVAALTTGVFQPRAEVVENRPLNLTFDAQSASQLSHIRSAVLLPEAKRISAILNDESFRSAAQRHLGDAWLEQYRSEISFAFNGAKTREGMAQGLEQAVAYTRRGGTAGVFFFNLLTTVRQQVGLVSAMAHPDIGIRATMSAVARNYATPARFQAAHKRLSDLTSETSIRLSATDLDQTNPDKILGKLNMYDKWLNAGTAPMRYSQWMVDMVTLDAAHNKAKGRLLAEGKSELDAEYEARRIAVNALIDTQGSAMRSEQAAINQNEFGKTITFAGKWMINYGNFLKRQFRAALAERGDTWAARKALTKSVVVGLVGNAAIFTALGAALRPERDDEEERDWGDYGYQVGVDIISQPNWLLRLTVPTLMDRILAQPTGGRETAISVATQSLSDAGNAIGQASKYFRGDDSFDVEKAVNSAMGAGNIVLPGIPVVQLKRIISTFSEENPTIGLEVMAGAIFGWDKTPRRDLDKFLNPDD